MSWTGIGQVDAWIQDQREANTRSFYLFLDQQRAIWTPRYVFNQCCVKWLADGTYENSNPYSGPYDVRGGCKGNCGGRAHPQIVLSFENDKTVARVTHLLDPFLQYFAERCSQGTATQIRKDTWELEGFVRANSNSLKSHSGFGQHLVSIAQGALEASDQAQTRQLEVEEESLKPPAAKRAKHQEHLSPDLVDKALEICRKNGLGEHLDTVEIAWLRTLNKAATSNVAARMAKDRLRKQVQLSYFVFLDGKLEFDDGVFEFSEPAERVEFEGDGINPEEHGREGLSAVLYQMPSTAIMALRSSQDEGTASPHVFSPEEENSVFAWDSGVLDDAEEPREDSYSDYEFDYRGHKICLYLESPQGVATADVNQARAVRIADFRFTPEEIQETGIRELKSDRGVARLKINVLESTVERVPAEVSTTASAGGDEGDNSDDDSDEEASSGTVRYTGRFQFVDVAFDFGALVGHYARRKWRRESAKAREAQKERPLMESEKKHLASLKKTAEEYGRL